MRYSPLLWIPKGTREGFLRPLKLPGIKLGQEPCQPLPADFRQGEMSCIASLFAEHCEQTLKLVIVEVRCTWPAGWCAISCYWLGTILARPLLMRCNLVQLGISGKGCGGAEKVLNVLTLEATRV